VDVICASSYAVFLVRQRKADTAVFLFGFGKLGDPLPPRSQILSKLAQGRKIDLGVLKGLVSQRLMAFSGVVICSGPETNR